MSRGEFGQKEMKRLKKRNGNKQKKLQMWEVQGLRGLTKPPEQIPPKKELLPRSSSL